MQPSPSFITKICHYSKKRKCQYCIQSFRPREVNRITFLAGSSIDSSQNYYFDFLQKNIALVSLHQLNIYIIKSFQVYPGSYETKQKLNSVYHYTVYDYIQLPNIRIIILKKHLKQP